MIGLVFASLTILASYVIAVCVRWGVPNSISQSFFSIRHKWIFSAVMAMSFALLFLPLTDALPQKYECLVFLTCAGGLLIASAPNLNDSLECRVHMTGAVMLGVASQAVAIVLYPISMAAWTFIWLLCAFKDKRVFFAEIIGGTALYLALIADYYL